MDGKCTVSICQTWWYRKQHHIKQKHHSNRFMLLGQIRCHYMIMATSQQVTAPKKWVCSESICVACLNSNHNLRNRSAEAMNLAQNAHSRQGTVVALLGCQPPGWGNITVLGKLPGHVATLTTKEWKGLTAYPPWLWESEIQSFKTR